MKSKLAARRTRVPKMFVHSAREVFTAHARARVAAELTDLGIACERLADTQEIRSGVWVFFVEHEPSAVFSGGEVASRPIIALLINAIKGGLDDPARKRLIEEGTAILRKTRCDQRRKCTCVCRHPRDSRDRLGDVREASRSFQDARPNNVKAGMHKWSSTAATARYLHGDEAKQDAQMKRIKRRATQARGKSERLSE
ncbi:hypothetical protein [Bradyrhizobium tropiciagri]|uniref:hypothetical protein n=1 Tax=Bradyrhizobium tropiciagri TaxID=312253 RepID=UPI0012FF4519|nr:hypothetical protein [Bradyrhizobium tropiciagri]